jgi:hypothetical protein
MISGLLLVAIVGLSGAGAYLVGVEGDVLTALLLGAVCIGSVLTLRWMVKGRHRT